MLDNLLYRQFMSDHEPTARQSVATGAAPAALGPYSQAIIAGGFVFCSGTVGIDPDTGQVPEGIEAQTELALRNLSAILEAAGASMADPPPARSAPVNVNLPCGLLVSIEAIARAPGLL